MVGLRSDVHYGAPILRLWITVQRGVGFTITAHRVGEQAHELPWAERGDLRDHVEGARHGGIVRGGDSMMWC